MQRVASISRFFACSALALLAVSATAAPSPGDDALARCERAVRQALPLKAGAAAELRSATTPPPTRVPAEGSPVALQGEGQWRDGARVNRFSYSCSVDPRNDEAVGVVIRQLNPLPAAQAEAKPIENPDLSHLSPSACESGAAVALRQRWPRVSQITFDTETRSLTQQSASRAELHGQGRARPAPESQVFMHFGFDCTIDPRDGRVIGMRLSG
jgi:hypothetical protein